VSRRRRERPTTVWTADWRLRDRRAVPTVGRGAAVEPVRVRPTWPGLLRKRGAVGALPLLRAVRAHLGLPVSWPTLLLLLVLLLVHHRLLLLHVLGRLIVRLAWLLLHAVR
jgi:hypothetical protein